MYKNFEVIDFHTHPYILMSENICAFKNEVYPGRSMSEDLDACYTDIFCGSVISKPLEGETQWDATARNNNTALKIKELYKDRYIPGYHIHPDFVKESCEEAERMYKMGITLIGELVPYSSNWREGGDNFSPKGLFEILDSVKNYNNMIVNFHSSNARYETVEKMIAGFPSITFVAAHPGQTADFLRHLEMMKKYENYYLDLSGTGIFRYGMIKSGISKVGDDRFIYGSDYPTCNPGMFISGVMYEDISDSSKEKILSGNARRILKLDKR